MDAVQNCMEDDDIAVLLVEIKSEPVFVSGSSQGTGESRMSCGK